MLIEPRGIEKTHLVTLSTCHLHQLHPSYFTPLVLLGYLLPLPIHSLPSLALASRVQSLPLPHDGPYQSVCLSVRLSVYLSSPYPAQLLKASLLPAAWAISGYFLSLIRYLVLDPCNSTLHKHELLFIGPFTLLYFTLHYLTSLHPFLELSDVFLLLYIKCLAAL